MRWRLKAFAVCFWLIVTTSCGTPEKVSDEALIPILLPVFGEDGSEVPISLSARAYEIEPARSFARGSWNAPQHQMFEAVQLFESEEAASMAFAEGQLLGRVARSLSRDELSIDNADQAARLCVDQIEYGIDTCDFPVILIQKGHFLISVTGGDETTRTRLAAEATEHLATVTEAGCEAENDPPIWCY